MNDIDRMIAEYKAGTVTWEQVREMVVAALRPRLTNAPDRPPLTSGESYQDVENRYSGKDSSPLSPVRTAYFQGVISQEQYSDLIRSL